MSFTTSFELKNPEQKGFNRLVKDADPAQIDNIIKKLADSPNPTKLAELLDKMFDHLQPETREKMFKQMVNHNPVFSNQEKEQLIKAYQSAKTKAGKKKL
jgi:hypothetical protein